MSTATVATAPTVEIGYAQQTVSNWWLYDPNETTPELQWPMSVYVYDQMRRQDAQVTSVLRAVTLPVRRTPWRIDPNGARDEVVQFVADDLGLPIIGQNPEPPPRSKDRFSWPEHLRQALLMLPFGHMYFEIVFRVDPDGSRAHLRKLAPRMPRTIERIDVADDGGLISISQYWMRTTEKPRPIPVDRLVAYVHELEGGNWLGTSILRPAYKNWLLKDRLLRVQAQTIERNGMGIPLYKAQEGATPTDMASGLAMATAWRAGDAAGSATPFGADLVLRGVEGTLPDAEPAIRYHDEQIARAVLAHFLNLGTQTGSWALGTTFADFFTLSLQTLAQQIADTATCHIVEDMVDINFGPDEPAPRVTFDEIGSRQAATAAAIKTLVDAGVIRPDQVLEESSRQQYGLPPADPGTVRQPPAPSGVAQPDPVSTSVAASADPKGVAAGAVEAKFNPSEPRIPGGPHGGEWGHDGGGPVKDLLKLVGRIQLNPGESLVSSRQLDFSQGAAKLATTNHGVRLGLGGNAFASDPWRAANKGLTVKLSDRQAHEVADGLDHAVKQGKAGQDAADELWARAESTTDPAQHAAALKAAQDASAGFAQPSSTVVGEWGTVHIGYSVTDTEPAVWAAVRPTNAPPDWDLETAVDEDAGLRMDPAEAMQLRSALPATRVQADAAFESKHHRGLGGKFATMVDRLINAIAEHKSGGGKGHPFDGFDREQLRRAAVKRGITLKRGEDRDSIAAKLLADLGGPTGKPKVKKAGPGPTVKSDAAARLARAHKGRAATAATGYRFTGNAQANADMFPDAKERQQVMDAFAGYRGIGSSRINRSLRAGGAPDGRVELMDKAFAQSPLKSDVAVWRGARGLEFGARNTWPDDLTGVEWTDPAFVSTSVRVANAHPFSQEGVLIRLLVPAGTPAVGVRPAFRTEKPEEEILLDRGLTYRVIADHGSKLPEDLPKDTAYKLPHRVIDVEVIHAKAPAAKKATTSAADVRRVGQDLIVKDMSVLADHVARDQGKYQSADGALSAIAHEQGFDGKPRVATKAEIDKLVAGGAHETFRGVGSGFEHDPKFPNDPKAVRRITAAQVNDQLRTGDAYYGVGIYGNGYYFTSDQSIAALDYSDGSAGSVVRAVLPKDAKIADTHTLQAEQAKFHMAETGRPGSNAYKTYGDLGRYAAARGYDALRHEVGSTNPPTYNYVILNRSALVVQEG